MLRTHIVVAVCAGYEVAPMRPLQTAELLLQRRESVLR